MKPLAEAAAAKESAEIEKRMAAKEHKLKQRQAEIERKQKEECARHERELAVLAADKKIATASAKLKGIDDALKEEKLREKVEFWAFQSSKMKREHFLGLIHPGTIAFLRKKTDAAEGNTPQNGMLNCIIPRKPHIDTRQ